MTTFKTAVFESDGSWWFRWWNVSLDPAAPLARNLVGPCKDQQEAEAKKQEFVEAEEKKRPWVVFESA